MFSHITCQLCYFDFLLEVPFEACVDDFPLAWFESVDDGSIGTVVVLVRKVNKLFVDELSVGHSLAIIGHHQVRIVMRQPFLPFLSFLFVKNEIDSFVVFIIFIDKINSVPIQVLEILLGLFVS